MPAERKHNNGHRRKGNTMNLDTVQTRLDSLEKRMSMLESGIRRDGAGAICEELSAKWGQYVNKSEAAEILGVTRATIYAMLEDGRLEGACYGRRISIRSIALYLSSGKDTRKRRKKQEA